MSDPHEAIQELGNTALFKGLTPDELTAISRRMRPVSFRKGQHIFARGDSGKDLFFVREGRVRISVISGDGRELSFKHVESGDIFGEIATLDGGARTADATAVSDVTSMIISATALYEAIERHPRIGLAMMKFLCGRIRDTDEQLESIAMYPIEVRLARFLLSCIKLRWPDTDEDKLTVDLDMPQHELAMLIGASRPKVNGAITVLEGMGAIKRSGSSFVCYIERLEKMTDPV